MPVPSNPPVSQQRWYAVANDLIGGWDVSTSPTPPSQRLGVEIASFTSQESAERIAELHNATLDSSPAQALADGFNAVRAAGLVWRTIDDNNIVLSEPGHTIGWVDLAALEYDEDANEWTVTA